MNSPPTWQVFPQVLWIAIGALAKTFVARIHGNARNPRRPFLLDLVCRIAKQELQASKTKGLHWLRAAQAALKPRSPALGRVCFTAISANGVPALWCTPARGITLERTIVYFHGGGYVIGSVDYYRDTLARLALAANAKVLGVDYRLAPEHRFPAAHEDCLAATRYALAQGSRADKTCLAGDSAGGALALATLIALRNAGEPLPAAGVLISPWVDPTADAGSIERNAATDMLDRELVTGWIDTYMGSENKQDPRVNLLAADLKGLPPLYIQAGAVEIFIDRIIAFKERAERAGVTVLMDSHAGMFHIFPIFAYLSKQADTALQKIGEFVVNATP